MLSVQDLIEKSIKQEDRYITIRVDRMDGEIKLRVPTSKDIYEIRDKYKDFSEMASELVYISCVEPKLNEERLIQHFKCKDKPVNVVEKIFSFDEKLQIADILLEENSKNSAEVKKVDIVKN